MQRKFRSRVFAYLVSWLSIFLLSCATPGSVQLENLDQPLVVLQKVAAKSLPVGKRETSINGREYSSEYFVPKGDVRFWQKPGPKAKYRYWAKITVLGDRRPYKVEVLVRAEQKSGSWKEGGDIYQDVGVREDLAQKVLYYYKENLSKGLKDRNLIDDFRVF